MKSARALLGLHRTRSRTARILMSTDASSKSRPDVHTLLNKTTSLDGEDKNDKFLSSAYNVDDHTLKRLEDEVHSRTQVDPRDTSVILFPGQGSQYPGMAKKLEGVPRTKEMFEYASSVMGFDLLKLCNEGPERMLSMTINCQVAILVTSLAALEKLKDEKPRAIETCSATAGFSVGEYAALTFAGALTFEEAVQVVKLRGEAMQSCSEERQSGLMTVFTTPQANINYAMKLAREWCQQKENIENPVCEVSNFLSPDCKVVGGDLKALSFLRRNMRDLGIKRTRPIPVSGAFHTRLMEPASPVVKKALKLVEIKQPSIWVYSNVTGNCYRNIAAIRSGLCQHVHLPVRWEQIMHSLFKRDPDTTFPTTYEVGPGNTLRPLLKALNNKAYASSLRVDI